MSESRMFARNDSEIRCRYCGNYHDGVECPRGATIDLQAMWDRIADLEDQLAQRDREVLALRAQLTRVIGGHNAPDDCYSTGPMTGDPITDLVSCPSCEGIALLASTAQAGEEAERRLRQDEQVRLAPFLVHPYPCPNHASEDPVNDLLGCTCGLAAILGTERGEGKP